PALIEIGADFVSSCGPRIGAFACSNSLLNDIDDMIDRSVTSNLQHVLTDCPHREKLGWLEVSHLMGPSILLNYDMGELYRKICRDTTDSQLENGLVPDIAPEYVRFNGGFFESPEWGSAAVQLPWLLYRWYGDEAILREQYSTMARYTEYLAGTRNDLGLVKGGLGDWYDWTPEKGHVGSSQLTPNELPATTMLYDNARILWQAATMERKVADTRKWKALMQAVRRDFLAAYYDSPNKTVATGSQCALALGLYFGLVPEQDRDAVVANLVKNLEENQYRQSTGEVSFRYLVLALAEAGRSDVVYRMINRTDAPGYGCMLKQHGLQTLSERWDRPGSSLNHCMFGHIQEWFQKYVLGIRQAPGSTGYEKVLIDPFIPDDLDWAAGSFDSPNGRIEVAWARKGSIVEVTIEAEKAEVIVPPGRRDVRWKVNKKPIKRDMLIPKREESNGPVQVPLDTAKEKVDWPAFMRSHDMIFDKLPQNWTEAPHFGNAMIGSMLYQADDTLRLQVFRADVHDHRDNTYGWTAYSRPRLQIGHFSLNTVGKLTGCSWRKDLWNAELTGTIYTDKGQIKIRHFTHAKDMAIVTELTPSAGEQACRWTWHPVVARTTRGGYPTDQAGIERFAKGFGKHHAKTLKVFKANPAGRQEERGPVSVWVQDFLVGGQYATAWQEQVTNQARTHVVSIAHTYPESTAADTAVADVTRCVAQDRSARVDSHRTWWHDYYPRSFVTLPDKGLESLYWQTIYRFGCTARAGRCIVDTAGLWFQGQSWPYFTMDWNIQSALWPVYAANRLEQGQALVDRLYEQREALIAAVRPVAWQADSAHLPVAVAWDMQGSRDGDMRYYDLVGNLPWVMHNMWWQYRFSMDDKMLRDKIFPLLRRSINPYLHMVEETPDGTLRLPPTFSPETGVFADCNFDLALFKWGCHTLLKASERLGIADPLIPRWRDVTQRLVDYPFDEYGFMLGRDRTSSKNHQHFSNLLMIYPLYLVNVEQADTADVMRRSFERALGTAGPGQRQAMVQAHAGPIGTAQGLGDEALKSLKLLQGDLYPNGLWYKSPCIESTLALANIIQDMLIQSWSDPAADESGPIRIFPATPSAWKDIEFHDLRTEGAFLVSAKRTAGQTQWIRIKSLVGEPCRVRPDMAGQVRMKSDRTLKLKQVSPGLYEIDLKKDEEVLLY
ncbi:MAG: hypothetical protein HQ515_25795, partial [Phycisphaeraceae bacterium]|nr:hypothetical protein [Phycisphaeraceae bacterium]